MGNSNGGKTQFRRRNRALSPPVLSNSDALFPNRRRKRTPPRRALPPPGSLNLGNDNTSRIPSPTAPASPRASPRVPSPTAPRARPRPTPRRSSSSSRRACEFECTVCLENMRLPTVVFDCGHVFCKRCIDPQAVCPLCRKPVTNTRRVYL